MDPLKKDSDHNTKIANSGSSDSDLATTENGSLYESMVYGLSLPERTVRSVAALVSGAAGESVALIVPRSFQDSKSYRVFVQQTLDMLSHDVGGVKKESLETEEATETEVAENYVARKTVGTFIDLAGMSMMHVSPLTVLAIVSDVAHGSTYYLNELASELKAQGVIDEDSTISNTADLLASIGDASANTADQFDTPPIDLKGLADTIRQTQDQLSGIDPSKLIPQSEINSLWADMSDLATKEHVSLFQLSSAVTMYSLNQVSTATQGTLATIRVTGNILDEHFFDHYRTAIGTIAEDGIYSVLAETSQPYLDAVWFNFSNDRSTITEDLVSGKLFNQAIDSVTGWFSGSGDEDGGDPKP